MSIRIDDIAPDFTGCFKNVGYARAYCRISSYLQTMANKVHNPLIAIQMALSKDVGGK